MSAALPEGDDLVARCRRLVAGLGIAQARDVRSVRPLSGGVASDIAVVDLGGREICVKFALAKLKVEEDWRAPVHRNRAEYRWLEFAGSVAPESVPELFGWFEPENGFAMEYLGSGDVVLWKDALLRAPPAPGQGQAVARVLGRIHAASTAPGFDRVPFENADDFRALRLEPYLSFTAGRHPAIAARLEALEARLYRSRTVLVHGDVSPKNILFRGGVPILLDAECASMGDPAFDVSFCLNHLILKAVHLPQFSAALLQEVRAFRAAYAPLVAWEEPAALEARVCALLPALMLARVDGKSPVEYLDGAGQAQVRRLAVPLIAEPVVALDAFIQRIEEGPGS